MKKVQDLSIVGFTAAAPGWYVVDYDIEAETCFKIQITAWVITSELQSLPVSPQAPLYSISPHIPLLSPEGNVFNRLGQEWESIDEYTEYAITEMAEELPPE